MSEFTADARREMKRLRQEDGLSATQARQKVLSTAVDFDWRMLNFGTYTPSEKAIATLRSSQPPAAEGLTAVVGRAGDGSPATVTLGGDGTQHIVIEGQTGSGKTVLLAGLLESLAARYAADDVTVVYGELKATADDVPGVDMARGDFIPPVLRALEEGRRVVLAVEDAQELAARYPQKIERLLDALMTSGGRLHLILADQVRRSAESPALGRLDKVMAFQGAGWVGLAPHSRGVAVQSSRRIDLQRVQLSEGKLPLLVDPKCELDARAFRVAASPARAWGPVPAPAPTAALYGR